MAENFRELVENKFFLKKTSVDYLLVPPKCYAPKFCRKKHHSHKTSKFVKVSPWKFSPSKVSHYTVRSYTVVTHVSNLIFLRATVLPDSFTLALYTTPYVPSPIFSRRSNPSIRSSSIAMATQICTTVRNGYNVTYSVQNTADKWTMYYKLALSPGHSQILSRSPDFSPRLREKIWEWPGDEATPVYKCLACLYSELCQYDTHVSSVVADSEGRSIATVRLVTGMLAKALPASLYKGFLSSLWSAQVTWNSNGTNGLRIKSKYFLIL